MAVVSVFVEEIVCLCLTNIALLMEEILHHMGCMKPCKKFGYIYTISAGAGFFPSAVYLLKLDGLNNC